MKKTASLTVILKIETNWFQRAQDSIPYREYHSIVKSSSNYITNNNHRHVFPQRKEKALTKIHSLGVHLKIENYVPLNTPMQNIESA